MCTVQVLLFPNAMGRSTQGLRTGAAGVCRKLFANDSTDRTDPSAFLKRMDAELHVRNMKRWNFDFQTETPLPGRYKWVPVGETVPAMKPALTQQQTAEIRPQPSSSSMQASKSKKSNPSTQSKITDFMTKRKRRLQEDESPCPHKSKLRRLTTTSGSNLTATTQHR